MQRSEIKQGGHLKKFYFLVALLFSVCVCGSVGAEVNRNGDFQFWDNQSLQIPLTARWDIKGVAEFRYGDNASFFYAKYYQIEAIYKLFLWLHLTPGYRQIWTRFKHTSHQWTPMYIPFVDVSFLGCLANWKVSNRFRSAYQIEESGNKNWIYRNRLRLVTPWKWTRLCMAPYIDDEVFFMQDEGFFQNRLSAGITTPYSQKFKSKFFYMLRHEKTSNQWAFQHVLGLHFSFVF